MKAQFHQCIPNPQRAGEMISVQICSMWALGYADPEYPLEDMSDPQSLILPYTLGEASEGSNGLDSQLGNYFNKKIDSELGIANKKPDNKNSMTKIGDTHPITFKDPVSTSKYEFSTAPRKKDQIAIIGYWRKEE